jgi:hypothetical protein
MWVTLRNKDSGNLSVGVLTYHNGYVMPCSDLCDPPDCAVPHKPDEDGYYEEYEWTSWSEGYCEECETEWVWSSPYVEIVAHAPVTKPGPFRHCTASETAEMNATIVRCIDDTLAVLVARLGAKQPMYHPDGEWNALMQTCEALRAAKQDIARYVAPNYKSDSL